MLAAVSFLIALGGSRGTPAGAAKAIPPGPAYTTDRLNLREGPATTFPVITVMPFGARVEITGAPKDSFYPVTYQTLKGWAHGDWLRGPKDKPRDPEPDDDLKAGPAWTTDRLNLRSGPGTTFSSLLVMPFGTRVTVAAIPPRNGFYRVAHEGRSGWASGDYLTNDKPDDTPPGGTEDVQRKVRATLVAAGLGAQWPLASKIVACESSWNPNTIGKDSNGYYSRGLWQINDEYHFSKWKSHGWKWNNPVDNTKMAIVLYRDAGNSWKPWSCYFRVTGIGIGIGRG